MLKKKIVANLNPDGQQAWVQRINKYNILHTENRSMLKTRIKTSFFKMKPTEFFFERSRCVMLPFETLEQAFENIDKVTGFCTNLHICTKKQTNEIDALKEENHEYKSSLQTLKKKFDSIFEEVKKTKTLDPVISGHQEIVKEFHNVGIE
jgi:ribosomal protein S20